MRASRWAVWPTAIHSDLQCRSLPNARIYRITRPSPFCLRTDFYAQKKTRLWAVVTAGWNTNRCRLCGLRLTCDVLLHVEVCSRDVTCRACSHGDKQRLRADAAAADAAQLASSHRCRCGHTHRRQPVRQSHLLTYSLTYFVENQSNVSRKWH